MLYLATPNRRKLKTFRLRLRSAFIIRKYSSVRKTYPYDAPITIWRETTIWCEFAGRTSTVPIGFAVYCMSPNAFAFSKGPSLIDSISCLSHRWCGATPFCSVKNIRSRCADVLVSPQHQKGIYCWVDVHEGYHAWPRNEVKVGILCFVNAFVEEHHHSG